MPSLASPSPMQRLLIFRRYYRGQHDGAALEYVPELSAIWLTWYGALKPDEYQYVMLRALEVLVEHRCRIELVDAQLQTYIDPRANEWEQEKLHPELYASGLRLAAIRPPDTFLTKMTLEQMNDTLGHDEYDHLGYEVRFFATMDEAVAHARRRYREYAEELD